MLNLVIISLAIWRLSIMLASEAGPGDILHRLRHLVGVRYTEASVPYGLNWFADGLICTYCNSIWLGIGATILYIFVQDVVTYLSLPFAFSAIVVLLVERV